MPAFASAGDGQPLECLCLPSPPSPWPLLACSQSQPSWGGVGAFLPSPAALQGQVQPRSPAKTAWQGASPKPAPLPGFTRAVCTPTPRCVPAYTATVPPELAGPSKHSRGAVTRSPHPFNRIVRNCYPVNCSEPADHLLWL